MAQQLHKTSQSHAREQGPSRDTLVLAAVLLSEDTLTDAEIANLLNVSRRTLARWKLREDMSLALQALYLLQVRKFHRATFLTKWPRWPDDAGPKTPDAWER